MRIVHMFHHLKMMKCTGWGNIAGGLLSMAPSDLALSCPACPIPHVNLPENWEEVDVEWK